MSRFSDFFRRLFGRGHDTPSPSPQAPVSAPPPVVPVPSTPVASAPPPAGSTAVPSPVPFPQKLTSGEPNDPGFTPLPARKDMFQRDLPAEPWGGSDVGRQPFVSRDERALYFRQLAERDGNLNDWQKQEAGQFFSGPVAVEDCTDEEASFLLYAQENFSTLPQGVFYAVLSGKKGKIDNRIAWADTHRGNFQPNAYQGRMRGFVDDFANGRLKIKFGV